MNKKTMFTVHEYDNIDSTNIEAKRLINKGCGPYNLVLARMQTQGKGQRERTWVSPTGNVYMSLIVPMMPDVASKTSTAVMASMQNALPSLNIIYKAPNDLYIENDGKVCGILIETYHIYHIIGIGINIASAPLIPNYPTTHLEKYGPINVKELINNIALSLI